MRPSTLRFLWIGAAILGLAWTGAKLMTLAGSAQRERGFLGASPSEISGLVLESASERIELRKEGERWNLISPEDYPADPTAVQDILNALNRARLEEAVSSKRERFPDFELDDKNGLKLTVKDARGKPLVQGILGKSVTGSFDRSYFAFDGSDQIYAVRLPRYQLGVKSDALKDRLILEAPKDKLASVEIHRGRSIVDLSSAGADWKVNGKPADKQKADEIAGLFERLEADGFASASESSMPPKKLGLDEKKPEELSVSIRLKDGASYVLLIGNKKDSLYYARLAGRPTVWRLTDYKIAPLRASAKDFTVKK